MYRQPAGFGKRLAAYLIDSVIVGLISMVPAACVGGLAAVIANMEMAEGPQVIALVAVMLIGALLGLVIAVLYYGLMWSRTGQTLGKKWLGIRVEKEDGTLMGFWGAVGRAVIGYAISSFILYLGFLWMLWDEEEETWHDKIFKTRVVEA